MYKENTKKRKWWELDNHHERIHGTHPSDDLSPYDPDVADAPEDIKRVGNDHTPLHNAKLSPTGYYKGFFHKDYKGRYAQVGSQHRHRHHKKHHMNVQLRDHKKDTDDLVEDEDFVQQKDHNKDTDDVVEDEDFVQVKGGQDAKAWKQYFKQQSSEQAASANEDKDAWDKMYAQEEDDESYEFVQMADHDNDSDDIPLGMDPINLEEKKPEPEPVHDEAEEELVQLIPHENDTDDVMEMPANEMDGYNSHHSKLWNDAVNRKAQELDDEIKLQESMKLAQKKAVQEKKLKAAEEQRKRVLEQKRREQEAKEKKLHQQQRTLDLAELYSNMVPVDKLNVQTGYRHHSANWEQMVDNKAQEMENELNEYAAEQEVK